MALPYVLFENIYENTGATVTSSPTVAAGWPLTHLTQWRTATAFRAKASAVTNPWTIQVDLGSGNTAQPTAAAIAGWYAGASNIEMWRMEWSDDGAAWTSAFSNVSIGAAAFYGLPRAQRFTVVAAHRYWRARFQRTGNFLVAPQLGVLALGRALDWTEALPPGFDAFGFRQQVEESVNERGCLIGVNKLAQDRVFELHYDERGFKPADFFRESHISFDNAFVQHALVRGRPFFFVWDYSEEATGVYLCKVEGRTFGSPFIGPARRGLTIRFRARREVA